MFTRVKLFHDVCHFISQALHFLLRQEIFNDSIALVVKLVKEKEKKIEKKEKKKSLTDVSLRKAEDDTLFNVQLQTQKSRSKHIIYNFKRTLFIKTKHNMGILGVLPFIN